MPKHDRIALEARLKASSDSISRRIGSLEEEVRMPRLPGLAGLAERTAGVSGPWKRVGMVLVAGLAVGWLVAGIGASSRRRGRTRSDWADEVATDAADMAGYVRTVNALGHFIWPFNYLGLPALTMPMGRTANGLPMAIQLVAPPFGEGRLLRLAHLLETSAGFRLGGPPIAAGRPAGG